MTAILSVILPTAITSSMLVSSTVAEPELAFPAYNSSTVYGVGTRVTSTTTHRVYESAKASNQGNDPADINNRVGSTIWWIDYAQTNRWKMFDTSASTQTIGATPLSVTLRPGPFNCLYLAGLDADTLAVLMKDAPGGSTVFSQSYTLENSQPADYYEYFFAPYQQQKDIQISNLPPYANPELTITLSKASGNVACGICLVGDLQQIGPTLKTPSSEPSSFSSVRINDRGEAEIYRRGATSRNIQLASLVPLSDANRIEDLVASLLDVSTFWSGTDNPQYSALRVFGLGKPKTEYNDSEFIKFSVNVQGLTS